MEEQIAKIIETKLVHVRTTKVYDASKEIAETFEKFNEWKEFKSGFGLIQRIGEVGYVNFAEGSKKIYTYSELFTYWLEHINK